MKQRRMLGALALLCIAGMLVAPQAALLGARSGLSMFLESVLPALMPFMIFSQLMISCGLVSGLSRALEPVMRPLFGCPGASAFALCTSLACGYPAGARVTGQLHAEGLLGDEDACKTALLCSTGGPVFITGALGAGLLGSPQAGQLLLISHLLAALLWGVLRAHLPQRHQKKTVTPVCHAAPSPSPQGLGAALAQAVSVSLVPMASVGAYMLLFAVLGNLLEHFGLLTLLGRGLLVALGPLGFTQPLCEALPRAVLEMSTGCGALVAAQGPSVWTLVLCAATLGWGGLSVQAQSLDMLRGVPLKGSRLAYSKIGQALLSALLCRLMLWIFPLAQAASAFQQLPPLSPSASTQIISGALLTLGAALLWLAVCILLRLFGRPR